MSINLPAPYKARAPNPLDQHQLVVLAREIAVGIHDIPTILRRYGLSDAEYDSIKLIPFFAKVLENETKNWESVLNTEKRTQLKAAAFFEDVMPKIYSRMSNSDEALRDVVESAKLIARVAGVGEKAGGTQDQNEKFSITINLGEDSKLHFEKNVTPSAPLATHEAGGGSSVQHLSEGTRANVSISPDPKGS